MVDSGPVPPISPSGFIVVRSGSHKGAKVTQRHKEHSFLCLCVKYSLLRGRAAGDFADVVLRFRHAEEPLIKPPNDVLQPLDTMPRLPRAAGAHRWVV